MSSGSKKVVYAALIGNGLITLVKFIVAVITRSSAMMAESFHSLADMGNQLLLLLGIKRSKKLPDRDHPFGYGKEQYFWSFIVANMLFLGGAVVSIYEGVHKIIKPHEIERIHLIYIILGVSLAIESWSITIAIKEFLRRKDDKGVFKTLKESKDSNLTVVLIEDSAALIGLTTAFIGVLLVEITGIVIFDAIASILIGTILALVAFFLANEMRKLLIGESASEKDLELIRLAVRDVPEIEELGDVFTMHLGPENILLAMNIDFRDDIPSCDLEEVIEKIERRIKEKVPKVKQIFIEAEGIAKKRGSPK